ncbi:Lipase domain protein [Gracilaria domingensis]|nr:Lipase domain protein [Gracilaria domingensis]
MQTTVELFNFSWFVYYHGTAKENKLVREKNSLPVKIRDFLYDETTDTKAIVAESPDRIIVAFKGTSSTQNLRTDIKVLHRSLAHVLDIEDASVTQQHSLSSTSCKYLRRAKVHAGFADAYRSIKGNLRRILSSICREQQRLVLFTGHSLGGALATLCSIDALINVGIPSRKIAVSTFGSPRVGNEPFQELYDAEILMHWRIVAGGDMISRLPKLGYRHVGKKVILTSSGELFIDPSALEMIFWHSQTASIVHHRKACYLLAIDAWCKNLGTDYKPDFWPFPVSENDSRKFATTFQKPNSRRANYTSGSRTHFGKRSVDRAKRLQVFADAIDGLRSSREEFTEPSEAVVSRWELLAASVINQQSSSGLPA